MSKEAKHTPAPLQLEGKWDHAKGTMHGWISTMHPTPLFEIFPLTGEPSEIEATARRIILAYNVHDDMLAALEGGLGAIDAYLGATVHVTGIEPFRKALSEHGNAMEAAIARAEGSQP